MENQEMINTIVALEGRAKPYRHVSDRAAIEVPVEALVNLAEDVLQEHQLGFDMLMAHTAVDWIKEELIELVYQLYSTENAHYLQVSVFVPRDNPVVPTVARAWRIAEWQEREVYDLFGVLYDDHKDLRRLLLQDDWVGHPLRKDYKDDFMLEMKK